MTAGCGGGCAGAVACGDALGVQWAERALEGSGGDDAGPARRLEGVIFGIGDGFLVRSVGLPWQVGGRPHADQHGALNSTRPWLNQRRSQNAGAQSKKHKPERWC